MPPEVVRTRASSTVLVKASSLVNLDFGGIVKEGRKLVGPEGLELKLEKAAAQRCIEEAKKGRPGAITAQQYTGRRRKITSLGCGTTDVVTTSLHQSSFIHRTLGDGGTFSDLALILSGHDSLRACELQGCERSACELADAEGG